MGIRINKRIGYGIELTPNDTRLKDFNTGIRIGKFEDWIKNNKEKCADIIKSVKGNDADGTFLWFALEKNKRKAFAHDVITLETEESDVMALVISDPQNPLVGHRYDDLIDYYESNGEPVNSILDLTNKQGIWPYVGMELDKHFEIPRKFYKDDNEYRRLQHPPVSEYSMLTGQWDKNLPPVAEGEMLEFLKTAYRPVIPDPIILFTFFLDMFVDFDKTVRQLRPMIYTYWS